MFSQIYLVEAGSFTCPCGATIESPDNVNTGDSFPITVSYTATDKAVEVGYYHYEIVEDPWEWVSSTSHTFTALAPESAGKKDYFGSAKEDGLIICGSDCKYGVQINELPPEVKITPSSTSVTSGTSISLDVYATDNIGLQKIKAYYNGAYHEFDCGGITPCSHTFPDSPDEIIITEDTTFDAVAIDTAGEQDTDSTSVTIQNSPPSFYPSESSVRDDFEANHIQPGESLVLEIAAIDDQGQDITFSVVNGVGYFDTPSCYMDGSAKICTATYRFDSNQDSISQDVEIRIEDTQNSYITSTFPITVQSCSDGDTQDCPKQDGVCSGSYETCSGGVWPGCTATTYDDYALSTYGVGYESSETSCDGYDNDWM